MTIAKRLDLFLENSTLLLFKDIHVCFPGGSNRVELYLADFVAMKDPDTYRMAPCLWRPDTVGILFQYPPYNKHQKDSLG